MVTERRVTGTAGESEGWGPPAVWQVALFSGPVSRLESLSMFTGTRNASSAAVQDGPAGGDSGPADSCGEAKDSYWEISGHSVSPDSAKHILLGRVGHFCACLWVWRKCRSWSEEVKNRAQSLCPHLDFCSMRPIFELLQCRIVRNKFVSATKFMIIYYGSY